MRRRDIFKSIAVGAAATAIPTGALGASGNGLSLVWGDTDPEGVAVLRDEVEKACRNPDYSIVTNFPVEVTHIDQRLLESGMLVVQAPDCDEQDIEALREQFELLDPGCNCVFVNFDVETAQGRVDVDTPKADRARGVLRGLIDEIRRVHQEGDAAGSHEAAIEAMSLMAGAAERADWEEF